MRKWWRRREKKGKGEGREKWRVRVWEVLRRTSVGMKVVVAVHQIILVNVSSRSPTNLISS